MTRDVETRRARERGRVIERQTDLSESEALTVAWRERGYSPSGIAKRIGSTEGTVKARLQRAVAQYGLEASFSTVKEHEREYEEITPERLMDLAPEIRELWEEWAERHVDHVPEDCQGIFEEETIPQEPRGGFDVEGER